MSDNPTNCPHCGADEDTEAVVRDFECGSICNAFISPLCRERAARQKAEALAEERAKQLTASRAEVERLTQRLMREIADYTAAQQTLEQFRMEAADIKSRARSMRLPTHKCRVCGALWQIQRKQDTLEREDAWNLCSPVAGKCCDNVFMGDQLIPAEVTDVLNAFTAQNGGAE